MKNRNSIRRKSAMGLLKNLSEDFTKQDLIALAELLEMPYKTAENYVDFLISEGYVERVKHGFYKKLKDVDSETHVQSFEKTKGVKRFLTETKIRAVKTYQKYGIHIASEKFGASTGAIYSWADQYRRGELGELVEIEPDEVVKETKQEINEKKDEINYKREIVDTLNSLSLKVIELENRNAELEEENKLLKSMFLNSQISLEKTKQS
jgi:transposase-like protein